MTNNRAYSDDEDERHETKAEKQKRTRLANQERERQEEARLIKETEGGRKAKNVAKTNKPWITADGPSRKRGRKSGDSLGEIVSKPKKKKSSARQVDPAHDDNDNYDDDDDKDTDNTDDHSDRIKTKRGHQKVKGMPKRNIIQDSASDESDNSSDPYSDEEKASESGDNDDGDDANLDIRAERVEIVDAQARRRTSVTADNLFDGDEDVDIPRHIASRASSRSATHPPTSDIDAEDEDDDKPRGRQHERNASAPSRSLSASEYRNVEENSRKVVTTKRTAMKAMDAERPRISESTKSTSKSSRAKDSHPKAGSEFKASRAVRLRLDPTATTKKIKLLDQTSVVKAVLRDAIEKATIDVVLRTAWPEAEMEHNAYGKSLLNQASRSPTLKAQFAPDVLYDIKNMIKSSPDDCKLMGDVVLARLALIRASAKGEATRQIVYYEHGLGPKCVERVTSLKLNHAFHLPGVWGGESGNEWMPARKKAFMAPALVETIREAYFVSAKSYGHRYASHFKSSVSSKPEEKELPIGLLTLAMTGIYASLDEYSTGKFIQGKFIGNAFHKKNQEFITLLEGLQRDEPLWFHDRMHALYKLVSNMSSTDAVPTDHAAAFTIIDLS